MREVVKYLEDHKLRITQPRIQILEAFIANGSALTQGQLEKNVDAGIDRVTVYRTLKTFIDQGLIHKIPDTDGLAKFALCIHADCHSTKHSHNHLHFKCNECGQTSCLEQTRIPGIELPAGYQVQEVTLLVEGKCKGCA